MQKHTQGPWALTEGGYILADLIAAAPDLLEIARRARPYVQTCSDTPDDDAGRLLAALDAAIAKATTPDP